MHRLLLTAAAFCLCAAPLAALAQPPWPASAPQRGIGSGFEAAAPASTVRDSRRITPRGTVPSAKSTSDRSESARAAPSLWTAFASLALVVGVILAAARLWRKHGPAAGAGLPDDALEILGKRQLDRRHAIQMVRCGSRVLVLGVTEDGLRALTEITDPQEVDDLARICRRPESNPESGSLVALFRRSHNARVAADEPQFRGRVDEVLAERFPQTPASSSTPGRPAHA